MKIDDIDPDHLPYGLYDSEYEKRMKEYGKLSDERFGKPYPPSRRWADKILREESVTKEMKIIDRLVIGGIVIAIIFYLLGYYGIL